MNRQALDEIIRDPDRATRRFEHPSFGDLTLRLLTHRDAEVFGRYLDALDPVANRMFGPHPLTRAAAAEICAALDYTKALRQLVITSAGEAVSYIILLPLVSADSVRRYKEYGIELTNETDCSFAPSVADACKGRGLGGAATPLVMDLAVTLGFRRMVLSGGTRASNKPGIGLYRKVGFRQVGEFDVDVPAEGRIHCLDMILELRRV